MGHPLRGGRYGQSDCVLHSHTIQTTSEVGPARRERNHCQVPFRLEEVGSDDATANTRRRPYTQCEHSLSCVVPSVETLTTLSRFSPSGELDSWLREPRWEIEASITVVQLRRSGYDGFLAGEAGDRSRSFDDSVASSKVRYKFERDFPCITIPVIFIS